MDILVFKTNLSDENRIREVGSSLDVHPHIQQWNVDLHDHENILRVVANNIAGKEVENLVSSVGYYCEELQ